MLYFIVSGNNYSKVNIPDTDRPSNIYVPGLPGLNVSERTPDIHNLYTDKEVALLPQLNETHPRYREWTGRAASADRLVRYLSAHKKAAGILEIGCGNGWLSHRLSAVPGSRVVGLDPNLGELRQAARIFRKQPNLKFIYGEFYSNVLQDLSFDIIVLAATVHCFHRPAQIIRDAVGYLRPRGELHLIDSALLQTDLSAFSHRYFYDPHSFWSRFRRKKSPFPWVCIFAQPQRKND